MTITNDLRLLIDQVRFEINYVDYPDEQYTVPVILTKERAEKIVNDNSIRKVRFSPILNAESSGTFTFEHRYLILPEIENV